MEKEVVRETLEEKTARLLQEKELLVKALDHPGTQMIFVKLQNMARASMLDYDSCDFATERGREVAHRIQARRYVILNEIPRMIDEIINVDLPQAQDGRKKWRFTAWLTQVRTTIGRYFKSI